MATKAELEQKVRDLKTVLTIVQDERDELRGEVTSLRGDKAGLERKIEMMEDDLVSLASEVEQAREDQADAEADLVNVREQLRDFQETPDDPFLTDEIERLRADKERLLSIAGLTEREFELSAGSVDAYVGKR